MTGSTYQVDFGIFHIPQSAPVAWRARMPQQQGGKKTKTKTEQGWHSIRENAEHPRAGGCCTFPAQPLLMNLMWNRWQTQQISLGKKPRCCSAITELIPGDFAASDGVKIFCDAHFDFFFFLLNLLPFGCLPLQPLFFVLCTLSAAMMLLSSRGRGRVLFANYCSRSRKLSCFVWSVNIVQRCKHWASLKAVSRC